jgi:hypothetical protein
MMTLIVAAAVAAQAPAAPAPAQPMAQHEMHMQMGEHADHKGMDCCKHCCEDMDAKNDGHGAGEAAHNSH